jgi:hypothetical protein
MQIGETGLIAVWGDMEVAVYKGFNRLGLALEIINAFTHEEYGVEAEGFTGCEVEAMCVVSIGVCEIVFRSIGLGPVDALQKPGVISYGLLIFCDIVKIGPEGKEFQIIGIPAGEQIILFICRSVAC